MNKTVLTGRLVKEVELSYLPKVGTPKLTFTLAVERAYQKDKNNKKVDFINCQIIGKHRDKIATYLQKGIKVLVEGELHIDNFKKDNKYLSFTTVQVDKIEILEFPKLVEQPSDDDCPF